MNPMLRFLSLFVPIKLRTYTSEYSGKLYIFLVRGKKILDTSTVNYSFNSLHRVFKKAFNQTLQEPKKIKEVLILGLGGGSIIKLLRINHGVVGKITAIEIDPIIAEIATTEFDVHQYDPVSLVIADAEDWVKNNSYQFDLICVDLFINAEVPAAFFSIHFIDQLLRILNNDGRIYFNVMIINDQSNKSFHTLYNYLLENTGKMIKGIKYMEIEENNRVMIIEK